MDHRVEPALRRSLTSGGVLALTLAALSPAASVFVTGSAVFHLAGTGAAPAILAGGAAVMVATLLYAELGSAYPHAGGVYHGIGSVLGPRASAAVVALGLITAPALIAFTALGFARYAHAIAPGVAVWQLAVSAIAAATAIASVRLKAGLWLTGILLAAELGALGTLTALEWRRPARGLGAVLLHPVAAAHGGLEPVGAVALVLATIGSAYACSGSSLALNFSEEIIGERRRIGAVVVIGGVLTIVLIALPVIGVAVGTPDLASMLGAEAPIAASVAAIAGPKVALAFAVVVAAAIFDNIAGAMIAYSRFLFAAARSAGGLGSAAARVEPRSGAPLVAAVLLGGAAMLMTLLGERGLLLLVSGELVTPTLMVLAVMVGRRRGQTGRTGFRAPIYPALPALGLLVLAAFFVADMFDAGARVSVVLLIAVATCCAYALPGRVSKQLAAPRPDGPDHHAP